MSDSSKAEKIAAARKKLKQFQSKAKAETASNSTVTSSCGTESSVNTNGSSCIESKQSDMVTVQSNVQLLTPTLASPPPPPPPPPPVQQINMQFEAIDPVPFDSTKLFDYHIPADNLIGSQSEIALNVSAKNVNLLSQPPQISRKRPSNVETIPQFSNFNQTNNQSISQQPSQQSSQQLSQSAFQPFNGEVMQTTTVVESRSDLTHVDQYNHDFANLLQVEKMRNHELSIKVTQQHSTIEELNRELNRLRQNDHTIEELQQQINVHIQTVNVLVGEKSALTAKLHQKDQRLTEFESECVELQGRLNASRHRVSELEKDLNTLTESHQKYDGSQQALCTELETIQEDNKRLKRLHQEVCDENAEIQHQLALKVKEIDELKNVISAKCNELEMARVRLDQLTGGELTQSNETLNIDPNQKDQHILDSERQIIELQNMISELTNDRDRTQQQYQTYVQHLTNETTTMNQRIQELTRINEKLTKREESLVNHVQELEKQIQKQISTQRRLAALRDDEKPKSTDDAKKENDQIDDNQQIKDELNKLREKLIANEKEKADLNTLLEDYNTQKMTLQQHLLEKDAKLTEIESELERLRMERPDTTNLLATIESDKVAASRAMAQNQELRKQLEEMQQAFVQASNDKLELTSKLQSEQYINRDVRNRFAELENELKSIKEKLHFKDEEMIRLTHENSQYDMKIQELSKRLDNSSNDGVRQLTELQKKLHAANKEIKELRNKLAEASTMIEIDEIPAKNLTVSDSSSEIGHSHSNDHQYDHDHDYHHDDHHEHGHGDVHNHCDHEHGIDNSKPTEVLDNSDVVSVTSTINIATNEAMEKLQERFKRTMTEFADLTEEKHRLEHLVTQLQSETETIGEYIALYQTQRRQLKQREIEKDMQLNRIAADREDMKNKLIQLNELIELLLVQNGITNVKEIMMQLNKTNNNNSENICENFEKPLPVVNGRGSSVNISDDHQSTTDTIVNECSNHKHDAIEHVHLTSKEIDLQSHINQTHHDTNTRETATKIINILTDIKEKNLRQDYAISVPNSVDHCACCSGKLEIV